MGDFISEKNTNLYAYGYDELNNVYTVRGISSETDIFMPRIMKYIPDELIDKFVFEEYMRSGQIVDVINKNKIISYSPNCYMAVVDFHGRRFTPEQVTKIMRGEKIELFEHNPNNGIKYVLDYQSEKKDSGMRISLDRFKNKFKKD